MRIVKRVVTWVAFVILALLVLSTVYGRVGLILDARLAPPASDMIAVRGRRVHVSCTGHGSPAYLLDAGLGGWSIHWFRMQPLLAAHGRVCAFDRAGLGWSEDANFPHDAAAAAEELAAVVAAAHIRTPFVYVGHSLGANFAIVYAAKHPRDVAALVLLEPGDPKDLLEDFHGTRDEAMTAPECGWNCTLGTAAGQLGLTRIMSLTAGYHSFSGDSRAQYRAGLARPESLRTVIASYGALPKTAYETMDVRSFGTTPVLVLSSTALREPEGKETRADVVVWRRGYLAYLRSLAAKSAHGVGPIAVPNSTHTSMVLGAPQAAFAAERIAAFVVENVRD